jgi:hypothetical protein
LQIDLGRRVADALSVRGQATNGHAREPHLWLSPGHAVDDDKVRAPFIGKEGASDSPRSAYRQRAERLPRRTSVRHLPVPSKLLATHNTCQIIGATARRKASTAHPRPGPARRSRKGRPAGRRTWPRHHVARPRAVSRYK